MALPERSTLESGRPASGTTGPRLLTRVRCSQPEAGAAQLRKENSENALSGRLENARALPRSKNGSATRMITSAVGTPTATRLSIDPGTSQQLVEWQEILVRTRDVGRVRRGRRKYRARHLTQTPMKHEDQDRYRRRHRNDVLLRRGPARTGRRCACSWRMPVCSTRGSPITRARRCSPSIAPGAPRCPGE